MFHYFGKSHSAIRIGDYKLIKFWNLKKTELYNLKDDLSKLNDLSGKNPKKVKELGKSLMDYIKEVKAGAYIFGVAPKKATKEDEG